MLTWKLILYSIGVVLAIFVICSVIDYLRLRFIEKPLFMIIKKKTNNWQVDDKNLVKRVLASYNAIEK